MVSFFNNVDLTFYVNSSFLSFKRIRSITLIPHINEVWLNCQQSDLFLLIMLIILTILYYFHTKSFCHQINQPNISDLCTFNLNVLLNYKFTKLSESLGSLKWVKRKLKYFKLHLYCHIKNHRQTEIKCHVNHPNFLFGLQQQLWHCSAQPLKKKIL